MAKASDYFKCTVQCGAFSVDGVPLYKEHITLAAGGDVVAQNAIAKQFTEHLRTLGVFTADKTKSATITYDMLRIES